MRAAVSENRSSVTCFAWIGSTRAERPAANPGERGIGAALGRPWDYSPASLCCRADVNPGRSLTVATEVSYSVRAVSSAASRTGCSPAPTVGPAAVSPESSARPPSSMPVPSAVVTPGVVTPSYPSGTRVIVPPGSTDSSTELSPASDPTAKSKIVPPPGNGAFAVRNGTAGRELPDPQPGFWSADRAPAHREQHQNDRDDA